MQKSFAKFILRKPASRASAVKARPAETAEERKKTMTFFAGVNTIVSPALSSLRSLYSTKARMNSDNAIMA